MACDGDVDILFELDVVKTYRVHHRRDVTREILTPAIIHAKQWHLLASACSSGGSRKLIHWLKTPLIVVGWPRQVHLKSQWSFTANN